MTTEYTDKVIKEFREKLADIEHQRWAEWQEYVFSICVPTDHKEEGFDCWCKPTVKVMKNGNNVVVHNDCLVLPEWAVNQWQKQIETDYKDLTEKEKESDREQVDRYLPLLLAKIEEAYQKGKKENLMMLDEKMCKEMKGSKAMAEMIKLAVEQAREEERNFCEVQKEQMNKIALEAQEGFELNSQ